MTQPQQDVREEQGISIAKLKSLLQPSINSLSSLVRGMILAGLDIPKLDANRSWYGDKLYFSVSQSIPGYKKNITYNASIILPRDVYNTLPDKSIIATGKKIDIQIDSLMLGNNTNIIVTASRVWENGISDYEIANREIKAECNKLGWFKRPRRQAPIFFSRIGLITSSSGGVGSDIVNILTDHGLPAEKIVIEKCATSAEITTAFKKMDTSGEFDAICFFRGGYEDASMAIFRDMVLFEAIVKAKTFTATGLNHEQDHPVIEEIVDKVCNTPTAFGKFVETQNNTLIDRINSLADSSKNSFSVAIAKIQKEQIGNKTLADSYYTSSIKSIQTAIATPAVAYSGIIRSLGLQTKSEADSLSVSLRQLNSNLFNQVETICNQKHKIYSVLANVLERETSQKEKDCKDSFALINKHLQERNLAQSEFKTQLLYVILAGVVAGIVAGLLFKSIPLAFIVTVTILIIGGIMKGKNR